MFLSRLRVLSFSSPRVLIKTTLYCFMFVVEAFFCLWPKIRPNGKSTKLSSDRHILLFGSVRCLHYVVSFFSIIPSTSTKGRSLFAFVSSRLVAIGAKRLLVLAGKEVERLYTLFARQKKKAPSSSVVLVLLSSCDLSSFYNYLWIIFARAPWASSLLFFYCLLVVQTVESSSSGGVVFSRWSFLSLSLTRALFHHS